MLCLTQMKGKPYTLFEIYFFLLHLDKAFYVYLKLANNDGVRFVQYLHRDKIFNELFPGISQQQFNSAWLLESSMPGMQTRLDHVSLRVPTSCSPASFVRPRE